jgi:acyl carrier protein
MKAKKKKTEKGLCKDKGLFTQKLKEEIRLNVAREGVKVTLKSKLKEDLDMDSLETIEMLLDLEDKYEVEIDNTLMDFNDIKTVGDLRDFLFDKTIFPEELKILEKERKKKAKQKEKEWKLKEVETVKLFTEELNQEYSDYNPMSHIDAEKEMQKIEEEEKKGLPLPKGGKQVQKED